MSAPYEPESEAAGVPDFLSDPIGLVRRRWRWIAASAAGALLVLVPTVLEMVEPTYRAVATVLVNSQHIPEEFVQTTVQEDSFERINALVGEVLARERLGQLADEHDLYPGLRKSMPLQDVLGIFRDSVRIEEERGVGTQPRQLTSRLFTISYASADPEVAAAVTNDLADSLTEASIRMRQEKAALTTEFLRKQLEEAQGELAHQESAITAFKQRHRGELPSELESNLRKLERLQAQRQSLALQIAQAETRLALVATGDAPGDGSPRARLAALRALYEEQLAVNTEEHPNVISLQRQVERVEAEIASSGGGAAGGIAASTDRTLQELRSQLAHTEATIVSLDARVANTHQRAEELSALEATVEVLRANHLEFLNKVQEAELAESLESAQQGEHVSVLDHASPPTYPERARATFLILAGVLALGFGFGVGLLLEFADPVLTRTSQIEERFHLPVLGSVPKIAGP